MFMEGLSNPHKLKELWQQSKAKKIWDNFQATRLHSKQNNPQPTRLGTFSSSGNDQPDDNVLIANYMNRWTSSKAGTTILGSPTPVTENFELSEKASTYDIRVLKELEDSTPIQSYTHWMNENALRMEMGIPLIPLPKHTISKIDYHDKSDSSSGTDDDLTQSGQTEHCVTQSTFTKPESNPTTNTQTDQDSTETLVIRATPHRRMVCWEKPGLHNQSIERFYPPG